MSLSRTWVRQCAPTRAHIFRLGSLPLCPPHLHPPPQSAAKRYKVTGSGKVMVRRAGKQHLNEKQSRKTKRNLR